MSGIIAKSLNGSTSKYLWHVWFPVVGKNCIRSVVERPSAGWAAQQLREAFAFTSPPKYLLRDRDGVYGREFQCRAEALGMVEVRIAPRSPWQPYVERLIGSVRRECLDHVIVLNQAHLHRLLKSYFAYITGVGPIWAWTKMPRNRARYGDRRRDRSLRFLK